MRHHLLLVTTLVGLGFAIPPHASLAATKTWSPFLSLNEWNSDINWSPFGQPTTNDDVVISLTNDFVRLVDDTAFVNSLLLTNGADVGTNGFTLFVDDATETATMTIGNGVGLSRLELDATTGKAADIDQLVINDGGQLDMDGGLIEIDTFLDANVGAEIVGRGTIELAGVGSGGRAAILDGTIIVDPAQTMTIRSTGGGTVDLDGGQGTTFIAVLDAADLVIDARISDPFDGEIELGSSSQIEVTEPWTLAGRLFVDADPFGGVPLKVGTIAGAEMTVTGTLEIEDQGQITVDAPVTFSSTSVLIDTDTSDVNPNPLLLLNEPVSWNDTAALGNGTVHFAGGVEFSGLSSFATVVFVDNNVTGPGDLIVRPNSRVTFHETVGGLSDARIVVEQDAALWLLPQIGSVIHESSIRLHDGAQLRHNGATINGTLSVQSGEAEVFLNGDMLIGTGSGFTGLSGSSGTTLRVRSFQNEVTEYGSNTAILGSIRLVHDSNVRIRNGVDLSSTLVEFAEADGSESILAVDGDFLTSVATLAAGVDSEAVANIDTRWRVTDSLFVGGSTTARGGTASLNLIKMQIGGTPRLEVANQLRIYDGSSLNVDGGHVTAEFLLMDAASAISFLDGTITVAGGAGTLPGTSLSFGTQAAKQPEFFVTDGADVAVQFAWRMATTTDGNARTEVTGTSPINVPSMLRNTGGGAGADLVVGQAGIAELVVAGGGMVDFSDDVVFGDLATGIGTGQVDGVASGLRSTLKTRGGANSVVYVGRLGSGSLDVSDGALVTSAGDISIADQANASGQIHLFQTNSPNNGGLPAEVRTVDDLFVGGSGFGNLIIDSGGRVEVGDALLVNNAMSRLQVDGGEFVAGRLIHTAGGFANLNSGRGELTASGSKVTSPIAIGDAATPGMQLVIAAAADALFGEVDIQGDGLLEVAGQASIGELTIAKGGRLQVSGRVDVRQLNSSDGAIELQAGTLAVTQTQFSPINNPLRVSSASRVEVPGGATLILGGAVAGIGGGETLTKAGGGQLALRGSTTLAGPLIVEGGLLLSDANSLPAAIVNHALLDFQQTTTDTYAGLISGTGTLIKSEAGSLTLSQSNTYSGDTIVEAGTLRIEQAYLHDLADVYVDPAAHMVLDFVGVDTIEALFLDGVSQATGTYGGLGSGADFESSLFSGVGLLNVSSFVGLAGDYNNNGVVDLGDYTLWRDNLGAAAGTLPNDIDGGPIGMAQYATWKANFGSTQLSAAATQGATVPEPNSWALLVLASTLLPAAFASRRGLAQVSA